MIERILPLPYPTLPPRCSVQGGTLIVRTSPMQTIACHLVIGCCLAFEFAEYPTYAAGYLPGGAFPIIMAAALCLVLWPLSAWRMLRFDLQRRSYEQTTFLLPVLWRKSLNTDDIAGIYSSAQQIWLVRRSAPKRKQASSTLPLGVKSSNDAVWVAHLGEALGVPSGYGFLARFPQRNPRYSGYDSNRIAFRKHPLQRLIAAIFSKAFALASLVVGGGIIFVLVRHIYLPTHFALTSNSQGALLSIIAIILLYAAGPQDVAFDLLTRTYTLSTGLLYFPGLGRGKSMTISSASGS